MTDHVEHPSLPAVIRAAIAAYNTHDAEVLGSLYADDGRFESPLVTLQGTSEITSLWRAWFTAFPDVSSILHHVTVDGDVIVIDWTETGTHTGELRLGPARQAPTGNQLVWRGRSTYRIDGAQIASVRYDIDTGSLLAAVQPDGHREPKPQGVPN